MLRILLLLTLAASFAGTAFADEFEPMTLGEIVARDAAAFFEAQGNLARTVAQMNSDFAAAREEIAAARPGSAARAQAEEKLQRLEFSKNLGLLSLYLAEGVTENSRKALLLPEMLGGAKVDGGIPDGALPAFETWVRSVRASLGARDGEFLLLLDSPDQRARVLKALGGSQDAYADYLRQARKARSDEIAVRKAAAEERDRLNALFEQAKLPDGGVKLKESKVEPLMASFTPFIGAPQGELRRLLEAEAQRGQRILACSYGPVPTSRNEVAYKENHFWFRDAPATIDALLQADKAGALRNLGSRAFRECPASSADAEAARRESFAAHPLTAGRATAGVAAPRAPSPPAAGTPSARPVASRSAAESQYCERQARQIAASRERMRSMPPGYAKSVATMEREYKRVCG